MRGTAEIFDAIAFLLLNPQLALHIDERSHFRVGTEVLFHCENYKLLLKMLINYGSCPYMSNRIFASLIFCPVLCSHIAQTTITNSHSI